MMPHPERAVELFGSEDGLKIFKSIARSGGNLMTQSMSRIHNKLKKKKFIVKWA